MKYCQVLTRPDVFQKNYYRTATNSIQDTLSNVLFNIITALSTAVWCYSDVIESVSSPGCLLTEPRKISRCRGLEKKARYLPWQQVYFWFRDWNDKRAERRREETLEGIWKNIASLILQNLLELEVGDLSVPFVTAEHLGWVQFKGLLVKAAFLLSLKQGLHWWIYCLPLLFPLQGEGISCRTLVSGIELWVRCSFASLHKIRLSKIRLDLALFKGLCVSVWLMSATRRGYFLLRQHSSGWSLVSPLMALSQINLAFSKVSFSPWSYLPNCIFEKCFLVEHLHDSSFFLYWYS